jgi:hypothetical protein
MQFATHSQLIDVQNGTAIHSLAGHVRINPEAAADVFFLKVQPTLRKSALRYLLVCFFGFMLNSVKLNLVTSLTSSTQSTAKKECLESVT